MDESQKIVYTSDMNQPLICPECGANLTATETCQDRFHQMLGWEAEYGGELLEVHHLAVLCYHLQHPSLYSPEGLAEAKNLLVNFVEKGVSPVEVRQRNRARLSSNKRTWKIKGKPGSQGVYPKPIRWTVTTTGVIAAGPDRYPETVRSWARAVLDDLKTTGNL